MRRGKKVAERNTAETTADEVVGLIVGSIPGDVHNGDGRRVVPSAVGESHAV
jgi:ABC-type sugar transport system ATPase subunit